jgi:glutamyl-tRNA(Gln) amidotransferase subunit D
VLIYLLESQYRHSPPNWDRGLIVEELILQIAVITTGGTIGSVFEADTPLVDESAGRLQRIVQDAAGELGVVTVARPVLSNHSEDLGPVDWFTIAHGIADAQADPAIDAVLVTHGTDTMAWSVAAAVVLSADWTKTVCFTGAFYPPDHPQSDASINLMAALAFLASDPEDAGVYVSFRSRVDNTEASIMRGEDIKPMAFDDTCMSSAFGRVVARYSNQGLVPGAAQGLRPDRRLASPLRLTSDAVREAEQRVAQLTLFPGLDEGFLRAATTRRDVLILQLYHCGTGPTAPHYRGLVDFLAAGRGCEVLMGTYPAEVLGAPYPSTGKLVDAGGHLFAALQPHFLSVGSVLGLACGLSPQDLSLQLMAWDGTLS